MTEITDKECLLGTMALVKNWNDKWNEICLFTVNQSVTTQ